MRRAPTADAAPQAFDIYKKSAPKSVQMDRHTESAAGGMGSPDTSVCSKLIVSSPIDWGRYIEVIVDLDARVAKARFLRWAAQAFLRRGPNLKQWHQWHWLPDELFQLTVSSENFAGAPVSGP